MRTSRGTKRQSPMTRLTGRVVRIVAAVPQGRFATYGLIARRLRARPRQVAFVMARLTPEESEELPWFRVVAANGVVSTTKLGLVGRRQIAHLQAEGVAVTMRN